jgi:hypothetical protein
MPCVPMVALVPAAAYRLRPLERAAIFILLAKRFSRLVIIKQTGTIKKRGRVYLCQCDFVARRSKSRADASVAV